MQVNSSLIKDNLDDVTQRINAACKLADRATSSIQLLAVSKTKPASAVSAAINAGQRHFGENYLQDALPKIESLGGEPIWHFIGAIQSNKTKLIAENFTWVHTVSSLKIARRLNEQRPDALPNLKIFLQVNIDEDSAKSGIKPDELPAIVQQIKQFDRLDIKGLMTLPKQRASLEQQRAPFLALKALQEQHLPDSPELSMGMSGDLEAAILEGATWVRIGTDIFGARENQ